MKLFLVHCGFYDSDLCDGLYEGHVNFFVTADSFEGARAQWRNHRREPPTPRSGTQAL